MANAARKISQDREKKGARAARDVRPLTKVERPLLEHAVNNRLAPEHVIAFCTEPGMYPDDVVTQALGFAARAGAQTHRFDFEGCTPDGFCDRLVKTVRKINAGSASKWAVAAFEGVPDLDEFQVRRCVRAINRLTDRGGTALLTMAPEAYQLVESLPAASVFRASDLLLSDSSGTGATLGQEARIASGGIPHLAHSLANSLTRGPLSERREYTDALCDLMEASLRSGLLGEEIDLRLAMLLLGRGTTADLAVALGDVELEFLSDLQRDAPLFGVDVASGTFSCVGVSADGVFDACLSVLHPFAERRGELCASAARLLLEGGRTRRGASVLALCGDEALLAETGCAWFVDIIDVGGIELARNCLAAAQRLMVVEPSVRQACETALGMVDGSRADDDACLAALDSSREEERPAVARAALLSYARLAARRRVAKRPEVAPAKGDRVTARLVAHALALEMFAQGRFGAAYRHLLEVTEGVDGSTYCGALLLTDFALARMFVCDVNVGSFVPEETCRMLARCNGTDLSLASSVPRCAAVVLGGASLRLANHTAAAERSGNVLWQAGLLLVDALASVRRGEAVRAHVQVRHAALIARHAGADWLEDVARILEWAVRDAMGEAVSPQDMAVETFSRPFFSDVRQVMMAVARDGDAPRGALADLSLDRNYLWLLVALSDGVGTFSQRFARWLPAHWAAAVDAVQASWVERHGLLVREDADAAVVKPDVTELAATGVQQTSDARVRINLLGRLSVSVGGTAVPDQLLDQRRLRAYLSYLAAVPSHRVSLYQLVESMWPECDFDTGNRKLYSTATALNRALRSVGYARGIVERSRADASVSLAMDDVSIDVDDFERAARTAVISEGNDSLVLSCAERAELLYGGDLYVSQYDAGRLVASRRDELRRLYVDAMVAGAEAALRLGSLRMAVRLAERAVCEDDLREDAFSCMVEALVASGRVGEARERCERYAARCVDVLHRPPSRRVLELVEGAGSLAAGA